MTGPQSRHPSQNTHTIPLSFPKSCLREPSHLMGYSEKYFSLLPEPRDKMGSSQPLWDQSEQTKKGSKSLGKQCPGDFIFPLFSANLLRQMLEYICLPVYARKENFVHMETFSFNAVIILFCNQWFANSFFFFLFHKLSFPCPKKKKVNIPPLYPKLEDFSKVS